MSEQEIIEEIKRLEDEINRLDGEDDSQIIVMGSELNRTLQEHNLLVARLKGYQEAKQELKDTLIIHGISSVIITTREDYQKMEKENFKTVEVRPGCNYGLL
ncbi:MAG: hypothetical protein PHF86_08875 [Candidatus Nanoarchaeia archaeon]|nr:hypothetical protein [Candidatus Nanoarchaeia archaeon]